MPIRKFTTSLLVLMAAPMVAIAQDSAPWQGSFEANGQCFCSGPVPQSISSKIVPTPIGGQTVAQVCAKLGAGPDLVKTDGLFNHTVYKDMQCGHGPSTKDSTVRDADCFGAKSDTFESCLPAGPKWALDAAYAPPEILTAANSDGRQGNTIDLSLQTANANTSSDNAKSQQLEGATNNSGQELGSDAVGAELQAVDNTAAEEAIVVDPLASFTGKIVNLGDDRYLQARDDLSPNGGLPGSRIILDGMVFLKDGKGLVLADLYRPASPESSSARTPAPELAATAPPAVEAAKPTLAAASSSDIADKSAEQKFIDAMQAERQSLEAKERAEQDSLAQLRRTEQKRAEQKRIAEISAEQKRAEQKKVAEISAEQKRAEQKRVAEISAERKRLANKEAEKQATAAKQKSALNDEALLADTSFDKSEAAFEAAEQAKKQQSESAASGVASVSNALRLPANTRASSSDFNYFEALPANYEFGGGGVILEASLQRKSRFQFLGNVGTSDTYDEFMLGAGYFLTPESATRLTVVLLAGVEHGSFELTDPNVAPGLTVTSSDTGIYLGALSRVVINNKFELKGGLGYSSFFEGDTTFFGGGSYHVTQRLDLVSRFELGDNDHLGLGIRYYY